MAKALTLLKHLGSYRPFLLHEQTVWEAGEMRRLAEQLRRARRRLGYSRSLLAAALGLDLAVVAAVENGYGSPEAARAILARARRLSAGLAAGPAATEGGIQ